MYITIKQVNDIKIYDYIYIYIYIFFMLYLTITVNRCILDNSTKFQSLFFPENNNLKNTEHRAVNERKKMSIFINVGHCLFSLKKKKKER